jgi:endonuclease/exonuclease/phosphatase family metal-dependent hydrolase
MAGKKRSPPKRKPSKPKPKGDRLVERGNVRTAENDNLSVGFADLVPPQYRGTTRFLDVVTWNLRWFNEREPERVGRVSTILAALNADIMVFQEVRNGSMARVVESLQAAGAGTYEAAYGTTGGDQRVAVLYDLAWVRTKDDIGEIFHKGEHTVDGKEIFPRLPLRAYFTVKTEADQVPFDFQLVGLHLKSQRGGGEEQRVEAATILAGWLEEKAPLVDADVIMLGDWNEDPNAAAWQVFRDLEKTGKAKFASINDPDDFSHLMYQNKQKWGSRLDLAAVSMTAAEEMVAGPQVVRWKTLDALLATSPSAKQLREYIKEIRDTVSDHMPVVSRYYYTEAR